MVSLTNRTGMEVNMSSEINESKEFLSWGQEMKGYCSSRLCLLPPSHDVDEHADEQGLTQALVPYVRLEGSLSQMLQVISHWVQATHRFYRRISNRTDAFISCSFRVFGQAGMMQVEAVLKFVSPQAYWDGEAPRVISHDHVVKGQFSAYAPTICLFSRIASNRYVAYVPHDEGFDRLYGCHTGDFPPGFSIGNLYRWTDWSQMVNRLPGWMDRLLTMRGTNYHILWSGFGEPDDYLILEGGRERVIEELVRWLSLADRYAKRTVMTQKCNTTIHYSALSSLYELTMSVDLEYVDENDEQVFDDVGMVKVFRISKRGYQMVLHTESFFQKEERVRSTSIEELIKEGYYIF